MGYYTCYTLEWEPKDQAVEEYIRQQQEENDEFAYGIEPNGEMADSVKWYDHEDDIKALSKQFPEIVFTLSGEGEEAGDVWKKYFKDGKVQVAQAEIVVAPFDPKKLK